MGGEGFVISRRPVPARQISKIPATDTGGYFSECLELSGGSSEERCNEICNLLPQLVKPAVVFDDGIVLVALHAVVGGVAEELAAYAGAAYQQGVAARPDRLAEPLDFPGLTDVQEHQPLAAREEFLYLLHAVTEGRYTR